MKILVLQLTRLGDVLCTLPALAAYRRTHPEHEIHFLVRKKFSEPAEKSHVVDHIWRFDTALVLSDLIEGRRDNAAALFKLSQFIAQLKKEKYDKIINLTFSPASSFLAHILSRSNNIPVSGYTRTSDFYLHIPDPISLYFRAQVGLNKSNHIHVIDLFASVLGVEIKKSDFESVYGFKNQNLSDNKIKTLVCHIGASQKNKSWPHNLWTALFRKVFKKENIKIIMVGAESETALAKEIEHIVGDKSLENKVGQTRFSELVDLIARADLFVGADSGPLHVANILQCPILNLSVGHVNFWETGPVVPRSRVLKSLNPEALTSDNVAEQILDMLNNKMTTHPTAVVTESSGVRYETYSESQKTDFWDVVHWLYFDGPVFSLNAFDIQVISKIDECCELALDQLENFKKQPTKAEIILVLDQVDEILNLMRGASPRLSPLINHFIAEKENIPPCSQQEMIYLTQECYRSLRKTTLSLYQKTQILSKGEVDARENIEAR